MKLKHIAALALGLASTAAFAAGENVFRIGVSHVMVHSKSPDLTATGGPAFLTPQPAGLTVDDATTLMLGYTRHLDQNWDLDLLLGVPPTHSVKGRGTLAPFGEVARIKQAAPTVLLTYNFGAAGATWRPFVGLGVNFTHFYDRTSTASGNLASGGPTKIALSNSAGLAGQAGVSYKINEMWSFTAAIAAAKVKTDLVASTGSIERRTTLDLRPVVFTAGLGYSF